MKTIQVVLILLLAALIGYHLGKKFGDTEEEKEDIATLGVILMLIVGSVIVAACNTLNYTLWRNGRMVYCGIAYDHRLPQRVNEHIRNGKVFDDVTHGFSLPRELAMRLEKFLIQFFKPELNIQYNR